MNKIIIHGRLGRDVETKSYKNKKGEAGTIAKFAVGVNRKFGEETDWFNCTAFGKQGELIANYFKKGSEIVVEGSMQCNKYEDKYFWNLAVEAFDFCGSKSDGNNNSTSSSGPVAVPEGFQEIEDEDIPF
ncbi:MAG: single-stranded DNA-binding protein [Anaerovoracaceae bacterium]